MPSVPISLDWSVGHLPNRLLGLIMWGIANMTARTGQKRKASNPNAIFDEMEKLVKRARQDQETLMEKQGAETAHLRNRLKNSETKAEQLQMDCNSYRTTITDVEIEKTWLRRGLEKAKVELLNQKTSISELEEQKSALQQKLDSSEKANKEKQTMMEKLDKEKDEALEIVQEQAKKLEFADMQYCTAVRERDAVLDDLATAQELYGDANSCLRKLAEPAIALGQRMGDLRRVLGKDST